MHARAVGVEDARHLDRQAVLPPVVEEQGLGAALAFVVAGAEADGIDIAPIAFGLGMHRRVAIDLGGRCLHDLGPQPLGQAQHVDGAVHARLGGLHGVMLVMDGRGRAGQIEDLVHFHVEREGDVVTQQFEMRVIEQVHDVQLGAGEVVVQADNVAVPFQQAFAQVRAEKTGAAGNKYTFFQVHGFGLDQGLR